jgi:hypothetical protein
VQSPRIAHLKSHSALVNAPSRPLVFTANRADVLRILESVPCERKCSIFIIDSAVRRSGLEHQRSKTEFTSGGFPRHAS